MLTGRLPFEADSAVEWARKHLTEQPRAMRTVVDRAIASEAESAVMRALSKEPAARQTTALEFYREFAAAETATPQGKWVPTAPDLPPRKPTGCARRPTVSRFPNGPRPARCTARNVSPPVGPQYGTGAAVIAQIPSPPSTRRSGLGWVIGILTLLALLRRGGRRGPRRAARALRFRQRVGSAAGHCPRCTPSNQTELAPLATRAAVAARHAADHPPSRSPRQRPRPRSPPQKPPPTKPTSHPDHHLRHPAPRPPRRRRPLPPQPPPPHPTAASPRRHLRRSNPATPAFRPHG